jgi:hypothetical protein
MQTTSQLRERVSDRQASVTGAGVDAADRLMDAQDVKDRAELVAEEARRAAMRKVIAEAK